MDKYYSFGGMTGHVMLGVGFSYNYSGDPIDNCTMTPVYTDILTTLNSTSP
jgi:hypothetical protein